jgi:hypothetical protein
VKEKFLIGLMQSVTFHWPCLKYWDGRFEIGVITREKKIT